MQQQRPDSSEPTCVSMKSDWSMHRPIKFADGQPADGRTQQQRPDSEPTCMSMKSDVSMHRPIKFADGQPADGGIQQQRPDSSEPTCVSMKSDWSMHRPIKFADGQPADGRTQQQRPDSEPTCMSMKSDVSMHRPIKFADGQPADGGIQQQRPDSSEPTCVSMKSDWSMHRPIKFADGQPADGRTQQQRPDSEPTCMSMKSDVSMHRPIKFADGQPADGGIQQQRPDSSEPTCVSMKSDWSMHRPIKFADGQPADGRTQQQRPDSEPTCMSMKSDVSMHRPIKFADGGLLQENSDQSPTDLDSALALLEDTFAKKGMKSVQRCLSAECIEPESQKEDEGLVTAFLKITKHLLRRRNQGQLADCLQNMMERTNKGRPLSLAPKHKLKSCLKKKYQCLFEGISKAGNPTLLNQIYTELYITEGGAAVVNDEHEVRQIEIANKKSCRPAKTIRQQDIFKELPGRKEPIRTVMTKGVAGIGKTVLTQKFTLDWSEGKANQDFHFTFPFTFRELNVLSEKKYSLLELIHDFFPETKEAKICRFEDFQVVFIFDGLDECRLPLDFQQNKILTDVTESTSVDVLLTNLIKGNLLPSSRLWITTRPAAANQIPAECVDMVTEVRGFTNAQKDKYFKKRSRDVKQAVKIISHIKTSRSLHIMCHIPVFCWITATVLEDELKTRGEEELPKTLTEMYIHFLVVQFKLKNIKYHGSSATDPLWTEDSRSMIESLGKLAFEQLQKGNLIFYDSDLMDCGIDIREASVYSGVFTQIFKEERGLYQDVVFCFVHLSVQEFLAALHVHQTFITSEINLLSEGQSTSWLDVFTDKSTHFYQSAVNMALQSPNGHLDLFLRFLMGLSLESNQRHLPWLQTPTGSSKTNNKIVEYIKNKISDASSPDRCINLFHCLNEMKDCSLVDDIQHFVSPGSLSTARLSPAQWSALSFILVSSDKDLDMFDLKRYCASEEVLLRMLPVVKASNRAQLSGCHLSERGCKALSFILSTQSSHLRWLDLSSNDLQGSGIKRLCAALQSPHCGLESLRLTGCNLTAGDCAALSSVLSSKSSRLKELDLSNNNLMETGVLLLSAGLKSPHCRLEILRLSGCQITKAGCASLALALKSNPSHLKELDLSFNHPKSSGVKLLSAGLLGPHWSLETLGVDNCGPERMKPCPRKYDCQLELNKNTANNLLKLSDNNRRVTMTSKVQAYHDHPERFDWPQVLCRDGLTDRHYWEVGWNGDVEISVSYSGIRRKNDGENAGLGKNGQTWSLRCFSNSCYSAKHNNKETSTPEPPFSTPSFSSIFSIFIFFVPLLFFLLFLYLEPPSPSPTRAPISEASFSKVISNLSIIVMITLLVLLLIYAYATSALYKRVGVFVDHAAGTVSFYRVCFGVMTHLHTFHVTFTEPLYPGFELCSEKSSVSLSQKVYWSDIFHLISSFLWGNPKKKVTNGITPLINSIISAQREKLLELWRRKHKDADKSEGDHTRQLTDEGDHTHVDHTYGNVHEDDNVHGDLAYGYGYGDDGTLEDSADDYSYDDHPPFDDLADDYGYDDGHAYDDLADDYGYDNDHAFDDLADDYGYDDRTFEDYAY